ncbi:hypothetical protein RF11_03076 [Thelohanellus kitauei]|uniref:Uncharacterized protein n=1 Tax=Thelohanellus kitauei TaxID=669202 RepID=A0A0C2N584_THEKT|nr:hypothetical protein RF11_03076 [Thelohanellus kitauei]
MRLKKGRAQIDTTTILTVPNTRSRKVSVCCAMNRYSIVYKEINTRQYQQQSFLAISKTCFGVSKPTVITTRCLVIKDIVRFHKASNIIEIFNRKATKFDFVALFTLPELYRGGILNVDGVREKLKSGKQGEALQVHGG